LFVTYGTLISKGSRKDEGCTRLRQILRWCGADTNSRNPYVSFVCMFSCLTGSTCHVMRSDFEGVLVLDEGHMAKNLQPDKMNKGSKTGQLVQLLQGP